MNIHFRSRINSYINYSSILDSGICCQGITKIDEASYMSCYATGGYYIPKIKGESTECPVHIAEPPVEP